MEDSHETNYLEVLSSNYSKDFNRLYEVTDWKLSASVRRIEVTQKGSFEENRKLEKHFFLSGIAKRIYPKDSFARDREIEFRIYPLENTDEPYQHPVGTLGTSMKLDFPISIINSMIGVFDKLNFLYVLADIPDSTFRNANIHRADFESHRDESSDDFNFEN